MPHIYLSLLLAGLCAFAHSHHTLDHKEDHDHSPLAEGDRDLPSVKIVQFYYDLPSETANWEKPINSLNTRRGDFYVDEESKVKVPMMNKVSWFETYHDKILSCKVVKLPFKSNVSALFILPDQGKMKQLENALSKDVLLKWRNSTKSQRRDQADLSEIPGKREVKISKAIHEAYLNVDENDTEPAATAAIKIVPRSPPYVLAFNRPFRLVIVQEETLHWKSHDSY
ncbi:serine protease inhibitor 2.1-like isoform X2 [Podarcis muralis]